MINSIVSATLFAAALFAAALSAGAASAASLHFAPPQTWLIVSRNEVIGSHHLADVNADGKSDLVIYNSSNGTVWVALSEGFRFLPPQVWATGLAWGALGMVVEMGDINGDKRADVVSFVHGTGDPPRSAYVYVALSTGSGFIDDERVWNDGFCVDYQVCKLADLNGDGRDDLVAFTPNFGLVWASLSTGDGFEENAVRHNYFCIRFEVCEVGDVEGDGRDDLILFKPRAEGIEKGNVLVATSVAGGFAEVRYGHGYFCVDAERCRVGDVNGDGRDDAVLLKLHGGTAYDFEILVSLSNGNSFINAEPFSWARFHTDTTVGLGVAADVNGDGREDFVYTDGEGGADYFRVMLATDQDTSPGPGPDDPTEPTSGFATVQATNCTNERYQIWFWMIDHTDGDFYSIGPTDPSHSDAGTCPNPDGDDPVEFELKSGHIHEIRAVAPEALGCNGQNDPMVHACVKASASFIGNASGGSIPFNVW